MPLSISDEHLGNTLTYQPPLPVQQHQATLHHSAKLKCLLLPVRRSAECSGMIRTLHRSCLLLLCLDNLHLDSMDQLSARLDQMDQRVDLSLRTPLGRWIILDLVCCNRGVVQAWRTLSQAWFNKDSGYSGQTWEAADLDLFDLDNRDGSKRAKNEEGHEQCTCITILCQLCDKL